jgi:hypothetical protein
LPDTALHGEAAAFATDQASGLRRMFDAVTPRCTLVLTPALRSPVQAEALAMRARQHAAHDGATLVIDAARTQVAVALDMKLKFDLEHALAGDCAAADACVAAGEGLWVLPAARALDGAMGDERQARRVTQAIESLARGMQRVLFVVPACRAGWIRKLPAWMRQNEALIPVTNGGETSAAVLTAVRQGMGEAEIDTFHLLFLGMGDAAAGRLLSGMAAIAQRHFGARLLAAKPLAPMPPVPAPTEPGHRSVESVF